jgi:hypothetical protein
VQRNLAHARRPDRCDYDEISRFDPATLTERFGWLSSCQRDIFERVTLVLEQRGDAKESLQNTMESLKSEV